MANIIDDLYQKGVIQRAANLLQKGQNTHNMQASPPQKGMEEKAGHTTCFANFPHGIGAIGSVHEVIAHRFGDYTTATGFTLATCTNLHLHKNTQCLWVGSYPVAHNHGQPYAGGLQTFGFGEGMRLGYVCCSKPRDVLWCVEEAINAQAIRLIIAEIDEVNFTSSRRLLLAAVKQGVGVILLLPSGAGGATAATARWRVRASASAPNTYDRDGLGRARWDVTLERARHIPQKIGSHYNVEWDDATLSLRVFSKLASDATQTGGNWNPSRDTDIYPLCPNRERGAWG